VDESIMNGGQITTVFFSWQLDRLALTGRNLIERALRDALQQLKSDAEIEEAKRDAVLDSDTQGVPGSPPIVETIFKKIDAAAVFVPDLTFVSVRPGGRPAPNPNVLIEYGWALKSRTHSRIVAVMNTAHGEPTRESLPFDLGHMRRPITYHCADDADDATRQRARKDLAAKLKNALKAVLALEGDSVGPSRLRTYVPRAPMDGEGRFRKAAEPIGRLFNSMPFLAQEEKPIFLATGAAMWLRLMPTTARDEESLLTNLQTAMLENGRAIKPLNFHNAAIPSYGVRGHDGFGLCVNLQDSVAGAVIYGFTSGEVWTIDTAMLAYEPGNIVFDEHQFVEALLDCGAVLARLGIDPPYAWIAGLEGVSGRRLVPVNTRPTFPTAIWNADVLTVPGKFSGVAQDAPTALEEFFVKVYDNAQLRRGR
jgi:hypothetical protein